MNTVDVSYNNSRYWIKNSGEQPKIQSRSEVGQEKNSQKKLLGAIVALGILGTAGVGIAVAIKKGKNIKSLSDIAFDGGMAKLNNGKNYTGVVQDTLNNGDKITLEYVDGILKKSSRSGIKNFEKNYEISADGSKIVTKRQGEGVVRTNITEIRHRVQKEQEDLAKIFDSHDSLSPEELKIQSDAIHFKTKEQEEKINKILEQKQKIIEEQKSQAVRTADEIADNTSTQNTVLRLDSGATFKRGVSFKDEYVDLVTQNPRVLLHSVEPDLLKMIGDYKNCTYDDLPKIMDEGSKDMCEKLWICARNNLEKKGNSVYIDEIPDIFQGIPKETLAKSLDNLSVLSMNSGVDNFFIGNKQFFLEPIDQGTYSIVYKISDGINRPVVFRRNITVSDNPYCNEMLLSKKLKDAGVVDVPKFYMGNPIRENGTDALRPAWLVLDYISKKDSVPEGLKLFDFLKQCGAKHHDMNSGMSVGQYIVDLGGIDQGMNNYLPNRSSTTDFLPFDSIISAYDFSLDEFMNLVKSVSN